MLSLLWSYLPDFFKSTLPMLIGSISAVAGGMYLAGTTRKLKRVFGLPVSSELGAPYRSPNYMNKLLDSPFEGPDNVFDAFSMRVEQQPNEKCLGTRKVLKVETVYSAVLKKDLEKVTFGDYVWTSFSDVRKMALEFGSGLLHLGQKSNQNISIFMDTQASWLIAAQGCFAYKFPLATVYSTLGVEALVHGMNETEVSFVITEAKLLNTMKTVLKNVPAVRVVVYAGEASAEDLKGFSENVTLKSFAEVLKLGRENMTPPLKATRQDVAVIMYTSGSTGLPKGVMISHGNLLAIVAGVTVQIMNIGKGDRYIGYLPLAHVLELAAENAMLLNGVSIGYGSPTTLSDESPRIKAGTKGDVTVLKPTLMAAVPAILDRIRKSVHSKIEKSPAVVQKLFHHAYKSKMAAFKAGQTSPFWDMLVFNKIKRALGGNLRMLLSGGAPLSPDTQYFMNVVFSCPVGQGYGLTETCGGCSIMDFDQTSAGNVGGPLPCNELKLIDWEEGCYLVSDCKNPNIGVSRGEVIVHGPNVSLGYYKSPEKTAECYIKDSDGKMWFHTGDIGQWNRDGTLSIIDRKKDLIKLQQGEYVSLGKVESALKDSKYADNVCVFADPQFTYCVALILPNELSIKALAAENNLNDLSLKDLYNNPVINKIVAEDIARVGKNHKLARFEQPEKIKLVNDTWTPENELVTAALKLKRENLKRHYHDLVKEFYK